MNLPVITLIGAGNAGVHLGLRLYECGFSIRQVFSRRPAKAVALATRIGAAPVSRLSEVDAGADLYLLAVRDDAIAAVAEKLSVMPAPAQHLVVHTSGATPSSVLAPFFPRYGVFYPLQTLTAGRPVAFDEVPLCIYAAGETDQRLLQQTGERISKRVYRIDDEQRAVLHVAAVFANNFTNHLYHLAAGLLDAHQLSFDLLRPLILETAAKVQDDSPQSMQTGPAIRGDQATIDRHLQLLEPYPDHRQLYLQLTHSIINNFSKNSK